MFSQKIKATVQRFLSLLKRDTTNPLDYQWTTHRPAAKQPQAAEPKRPNCPETAVCTPQPAAPSEPAAPVAAVSEPIDTAATEPAPQESPVKKAAKSGKKRTSVAKVSLDRIENCVKKTTLKSLKEQLCEEFPACRSLTKKAQMVQFLADNPAACRRVLK